jgi:hypothetical protein
MDLSSPSVVRHFAAASKEDSGACYPEMGAIFSSELSVLLSRATRRHIPEGNILQILSFHGGNIEECCLLGYDDAVWPLLEPVGGIYRLYLQTESLCSLLLFT